MHKKMYNNRKYTQSESMHKYEVAYDKKRSERRIIQARV